MELTTKIDLIIVLVILATAIGIKYGLPKLSAQKSKKVLLLMTMFYIAIFSYFSSFIGVIIGSVFAFGIVALFRFYVEPLINWRLYDK